MDCQLFLKHQGKMHVLVELTIWDNFVEAGAWGYFLSLSSSLIEYIYADFQFQKYFGIFKLRYM